MKTSLVMVVAAIGLAGCGNEPAATSSPRPQKPRFECTAYYRSSTATSRQESKTLSLGPESERGRASFEDLTFRAWYSNDPYEGRSLMLFVADNRTKKRLTEQLYQLEGSEAPVNQFAGDQGFTGLNYVHHPVSSAELQYICTAE